MFVETTVSRERTRGPVALSAASTASSRTPTITITPARADQATAFAFMARLAGNAAGTAPPSESISEAIAIRPPPPG